MVEIWTLLHGSLPQFKLPEIKPEEEPKEEPLSDQSASAVCSLPVSRIFSDRVFTFYYLFIPAFQETVNEKEKEKKRI